MANLFADDKYKLIKFELVSEMICCVGVKKCEPLVVCSSSEEEQMMNYVTFGEYTQNFKVFIHLFIYLR